MNNITLVSYRNLLAAAAPALAIGLCSVSAAAQQPVVGQRGVAELRGVINVRELAELEPQTPKPARRVTPFMPMPPSYPLPPGITVPRGVEAPAEASAPPTPLVPSPGPASSFEALGDNNTSIPPDTQGAVGPNHLMVTLNSQVRIQSRTGMALSTVSLETFWSSTGITDAFDPRVAYDPFQNRWITVAVSDAFSAASALLVAVSQTSDPTGAYWCNYSPDIPGGRCFPGDYGQRGRLWRRCAE